MFKFSKKSKILLNTINVDLKRLAEEVLKISFYDFGISSGYRTQQEQMRMFAEKRSFCDGILKKSKHQNGEAIDIIVYDENGNITWDKKYFYQVIGVFKSVAKQLKIKIRCGCDFQNVEDCPHIELEK